MIFLKAWLCYFILFFYKVGSLYWKNDDSIYRKMSKKD